jgi:hypothetical protein
MSSLATKLILSFYCRYSSDSENIPVAKAIRIKPNTKTFTSQSFAFRLFPSTFYLLPFAFWLLPSAFCLLPSAIPQGFVINSLETP